MQVIRRAHLVVAWAFVAGVVLQVFLAGRGVFESSLRFKDHAGWGYMLGMVGLLLFVLAAVGRLGRRQVLYALGLWGLIALQSVFVAIRTDYPIVAALHPLNGFAIFFVGIAMAREAWAAREVGQRVETTSTEPATGPATQ